MEINLPQKEANNINSITNFFKNNKYKKSYREIKNNDDKPTKSYKVTIIAIIVFSIIGFLAGQYTGKQVGIDLGYSLGYEKGLLEGTDTGKIEGYEAGYSDGKNYGWDVGWTFGNQTGYVIGYDVGTESGYIEGYHIGEETGYDSGYDSGYDTGFTEGFSTTGWQIRDPTYAEMKEFLRKDKTDQLQYEEMYFDCDDFAAIVKQNAFENGYRCFFVTMEFPGGPGHAIIAFETTDSGLIFVEPQSDKIMNVEIGEPYWDKTVITLTLVP
ncbi:MAG: hypothetical protein NWE89_04300 [Candidatus Bathyarchaeota archaeon]|nr:hypothetical protein [Candidatus Bathyarchaeota archaeon]